MFPSDREYKTRGIAPIKETRPVEVVKTKLAGNNLGRYENSGRKQKRLKKESISRGKAAAAALFIPFRWRIGGLFFGLNSFSFGAIIAKEDRVGAVEYFRCLPLVGRVKSSVSG